ncbi:MAG: 50S ribosomal protein L9 [Alphaproteobacteria bacterium]
MEVILLERVEKLGQMGDVVRVKPGFARNYLLPKNKALRSTAENRKLFEAQKAQLETNNLEQKKEAEAVAAKMDGLSVVILRQASESGQLYGSVNSRDIAQAVTEAGFTLDRHQVQLQATIKHLGLSAAPIRLHPEVSVEVTINVARSADEATAQAAGTPVNAAEAFFESEELAARAREDSADDEYNDSDAPSAPNYGAGEESTQDA